MSTVDLNNSIKEFVFFKVLKISNLRLLEINGEPLVLARGRRQRAPSAAADDAPPLLRRPLQLVVAARDAAGRGLVPRGAGDGGAEAAGA